METGRSCDTTGLNIVKVGRSKIPEKYKFYPWGKNAKSNSMIVSKKLNRFTTALVSGCLYCQRRQDLYKFWRRR